MENTKPKSRLKKVLIIIGIIVLVIAIGMLSPEVPSVYSHSE